MEKTIFTIPKGQEEIRGIIQEYRGQHYVNVRTWYPGKNAATGQLEMMPSQKGISIPVAQYPELKAGILAMEEDIIQLLVGQVQERVAV